MKIGVCEKDLPGNLEENFKWIVENGFDGFQIWPDKVKDAKELLNMCKNEGILISAIGGGPNLVNPETKNITIDEFKKRIEIAVSLESNIITAETKEKPEKLSEEEAWKWCCEIVREICEECKKGGIYLAIEPSGSCFIKDYFMWKQLSDRVKIENLKVNYDPANILWAGRDVIEGVHFLKKDIAHTHAKNIIFGKEEGYIEGESKIIVRDVPLDEGEVDYKEYINSLKEIEYDGFLTIEMHCKKGEDRKEDILKSKKYIEKLIRQEG
ncbi:sugar phosphate isomerase/epimerase [bacterium]|nr:sugar phosphate isomerase/epimerase [bacterium]